MKYLLDTSTFLWFTEEPEQLTRRVFDLIVDSGNEIMLSYVSAWELAIKVATGRLRFEEPLENLLPRTMNAHGFTGLPIELRHVLAASSLPLLHRDPFDRLLVCQARSEDLSILTRDREIAQYDVSVIW